VLAPPAENGPSDGQLLARFVASRDEPSFTALLRRHGAMVWRLCLRVLGHVQDAEDAFQATFIILASKAGSVRKRESVGSWLFGVAYRTACEARGARSRRQARERQVEEMPHPTTAPAESQDWRAWLDHELNGLPEKYRVVIVACDLEGRSRRQAACLLGLAEGTVSSRLARGRSLLAGRLARHGLSLSGAALAAAFSEGAARAVSPLLVANTSKTAVLVAAGQLSAVSGSVDVLVKGVLKTMLVSKLRVMVGALMVVLAMGAGGVVYRASGQSAPGERQPLTEVEALRRENELLKLNLEVVLEKVRAQEAELRKLRAEASSGRKAAAKLEYERAIRQAENQFKKEGLKNQVDGSLSQEWLRRQAIEKEGHQPRPEKFRDKEMTVPPTAAETVRAARQREEVLRHLEAAIKVLRESHDTEAQKQATESVQKALQWLGKQQDRSNTPDNVRKK
jgi:RNA polymerase sigma factor (sigma-70 family)